MPPPNIWIRRILAAVGNLPNNIATAINATEFIDFVTRPKTG